MKTLLRIARVEVNLLFYSPVAWLVLAVFTIQSGGVLFDMMQEYEIYQQTGLKFNELTDWLFGMGIFGMFKEVQQNLYLYIPLLTMGTISRELSSGSIKLLFSSPVSVVQIVFGKMLSIMVLGGLFIGVLGLYSVGGYFAIDGFDTGLILSGLLGLYLLICAYAAIGIFMSSLTSYQPIAALATLAVFAALNTIGKLWQDMSLMRELTYLLSITGRANTFIGGLIVTREVFYFITIIILFVGLTILGLLARRETRSPIITIFRYLALILLVIGFGYITSRPTLTAWHDATAHQTKTLTAASRDIISQLPGPVTIHTYTNIIADYHYLGMPAWQNDDYRFFDNYRRFMPDMKQVYHIYYDTAAGAYIYGLHSGSNTAQIAAKMAEAEEYSFDKLITPAQIRRMKDVQKEDGHFFREIQSGDKSAVLRTFQESDGKPEEQEIAAALKRLTMKAPRIAFIDMSDMRKAASRGDAGYRNITFELHSKNALVNQGFDLLMVNPDSVELPGDIATLVIAGIEKPFSAVALQSIQKFIDTGGNILITTEPGKQHIIEPLLRPLGVNLSPGQLYSATKQLSPDLIISRLAPGAGLLDETIARLVEENAEVSAPGAAVLNYSDSSGFIITPLLVANPGNTWLRTRALDIDTGRVAYEPTFGDRRESFPVSIAMHRNVGEKQQRIIISADADFMSNVELSRSNVRISNARFTLEMFSWLSGGEFPVNVLRPVSYDRIKLSAVQIQFMRWFYLAGLPLLIIAIGGWILYSRSRH